MAVHLIRQGGNRPSIQKYGGGRFTVSGTTFAGSILMLPSATLPWPVATFDELTAAAFEPVEAHAGEFDFCLLGCGAVAKSLPPALRTFLKNTGVRVEPMATGAACRTFNVLMAEGRVLAAALIAV